MKYKKTIHEYKKYTLYFLLCFCIIILITCKKDEIAPSIFLDYQTVAELELPFANRWFVVWGGRTLKENYHSSLVDQRFAIDVVQLENGSTFKTNGTQNEYYYCYGDTLYAPGSGEVVEMQNTVVENIPGETNTNQLFGNYVILDHGKEEYSYQPLIKHAKITITSDNEMVKDVSRQMKVDQLRPNVKL